VPPNEKSAWDVVKRDDIPRMRVWLAASSRYSEREHTGFSCLEEALVGRNTRDETINCNQSCLPWNSACGNFVHLNAAFPARFLFQRPSRRKFALFFRNLGIFNQKLVSRCTIFVIAVQSRGVNLYLIRINFEALDFLA
jgi:hypothetical protein